MDRSVLGPQLRTQRLDHPDRGRSLLIGVTPRGRLPRTLLLRHESILVPKLWRLHRTQGDSLSRPCSPLTTKSRPVAGIVDGDADHVQSFRHGSPRIGS